MALRKKIVPFAQTGLFSRLFQDYVDGKVSDFHPFEPSAEGINAFTGKHPYTQLNRQLLVEELEAQNKGLTLSEAGRRNLDSLLKSNTFTITTGHQLCLATGPLYFVYKILSAIRIAEDLNIRYTNLNFVPVYWMATEDHDLEEINHLVLFNKKYEWLTSQKGRVGEFSTAGITDCLAEIKSVLGENESATQILSVLSKAYAQKNLADATRYLVNELFGKYGLIIVDGNSARLKKQFAGEIKRDAFEHFAFQAVEASSKKLHAHGHDAQVTPRAINSFYAGPGLRERMVAENGVYRVLNSNIEFTREQLQATIESETEKFSPNVVLRPLYQQKILPNAAYVGGPGEIAYWLQYHALFKEAGIPYPVVIPRNFILYVESGLQQRLEKLKLKAEDFFAVKAQLMKRYAIQQQPFGLEKEKQMLQDIFAQAKARIVGVDKTLEAATEAELHKTIKGLETLEQKAIRSIKQRSEQSLNQIEAIYGRLFPGGQPQERVENFLRFYISNPDFLEDVKQAITPFCNGLEILVESEAGN